MQKITLEPGETVEINGAIIGMEIVDTLLNLQLGIEHPLMSASGSDKGVECRQKDYDDLIIFLASEAGNIENHEDLAAFLCSISYMKKMWNRFRIPCTKKVEL